LLSMIAHWCIIHSVSYMRGSVRLHVRLIISQAGSNSQPRNTIYRLLIYALLDIRASISNMTIENYRKMVYRGLAGPDTSTCFLEALDTLSKTRSIRPETYKMWHANFQKQSEGKLGKEEIKQAYRQVLSDLGIHSLNRIASIRTTSRQKTEKILNMARTNGWMVTIVTQSLHTTGLEPTDNGWKTVGSSWIKPGEEIASSDVYCYLHTDSDRLHGKLFPSIILIAPEGTKTISCRF